MKKLLKNETRWEWTPEINEFRESEGRNNKITMLGPL